MESILAGLLNKQLEAAYRMAVCIHTDRDASWTAFLGMVSFAVSGCTMTSSILT